MGPSQSKPPPPAQPPAAKKAPPPAAAADQQRPAASPTTPIIVKKRVPVKAANPTDSAILELKLQRDRLQKASIKYEKLSDKLKAAAVEAMKAADPDNPGKAKANAILLIKRSKDYEKQIDNCSNNLLNIETSLNALEDAQIQMQVMKALEGGAKQLDEINKELSHADDVMEQLREAIQESKEISGILATPLVMEAADDDELEDELLKLMGQQKLKATAPVATDIGVGKVAVPNHPLPEKAEPAQQQQQQQQKENIVEEHNDDEPALVAA